MSSLREKYKKEVQPKLMKAQGLGNPLAVPAPLKLIVNIGVGWAKDNPKLLEAVERELTAICGQKPCLRKAKKSEAGFKLRAGEPVGFSVTLRRRKMWGFLDKLINVVLPRVKDFRGLSQDSFDGQGNYSLGLDDHTVFPEVDPNKTDRIKSLGVTIVTTAKNDRGALELLKELGVPFR